MWLRRAFEMGRMERTADRLAMLLEDVRSAVAKLPDTPVLLPTRTPDLRTWCFFLLPGLAWHAL